MPKDLTLAYEWEVVLINSLSKIGKVSYEKDFGGGTHPDIYFEAYDPQSNFVADITTISDKGLKESNPYEILATELYKRVRDQGLSPNLFNIEIGDIRKGVGYKGGPKVKLKMPGRARMSEIIFNAEFEKFICAILQECRLPHTYIIDNQDAKVSISYQPDQKFASGHYTSFTVINSLTENTIYQALESKRIQLENTEYEGHLGIILCDGGSSLFRQNSTCGLSYSTDEVINDFLSNNDRIDFIVTFTVKQQNSIMGFGCFNNSFTILVRFYPGPKFSKKNLGLQDIFEKVIKVLPKPEAEPKNALYFLQYLKKKSAYEGRSKYGGMELSAKKIKISARSLLELLAGKVQQKDLFKAHEFIPSSLRPGQTLNPFDNALKRGELFISASIERLDASDDDWIVFELSGPDPAISPFIVPKITLKF